MREQVPVQAPSKAGPAPGPSFCPIIPLLPPPSSPLEVVFSWAAASGLFQTDFRLMPCCAFFTHPLGEPVCGDRHVHRSWGTHRTSPLGPFLSRHSLGPKQEPGRGVGRRAGRPGYWREKVGRVGAGSGPNPKVGFRWGPHFP